jgi:hypothetical protein
MTIDINNDAKQNDQPFNIDMDIPTTLPQGRGGFVPASTVAAEVQVKRSTFLVRMPMLCSRGILIKRLATILLPRHQNIAFLPHTSSTHDKLTDHELVPTDDIGINHYIFDEKTFTRNRGSKNEYKLLECKIQVESPISLYQIKGAPAVMELLKKHDIYITAKTFCKAVSTKAIGILMNLDAKRSAKNKIIEDLKKEVDESTQQDVFVDLIPHRGLVRIGKKVIFGQFLKVMVDINYATTAAKIIQDGLKNTVFGIGMKNVRLMPVYPIPNLMTAEMFGKMILAHNDSMYGIAEIQVDNIWEIDTPSHLPESIKNRFNLPDGVENKDDLYTLREVIMPIFWGHYNNTPVVRDVYIMRGRLMIVCEKEKLAETTKLVDMLFEFLKDEFNVESNTLTKSADKFAAWVGCSTPKNENRHPARTGTLVFGEGGLLKATVNSFLDTHLDNLPAGLVPKVGKAAKKPDLSRPPPMSLMSKGSTRAIVDPAEFTPQAVNAWASAKVWGGLDQHNNTSRKKKTTTQKSHKAPAKEVIEIDDFTNSTVSMTSGTQAALDAMRQSVRVLEQDKKQHETKIASMDKTMEQIAKDVTTISNSQRQSNTEYVQLKEQILNIAQANGEMKKEMKEMKDMIMCIATHLGGVRTEAVTASNSSTPQHQQPTQSTTQSQYYSQFSNSSLTLQQSQGMSNLNMETGSKPAPAMTEPGGVSTTDDMSRKKLKQRHLQVFDTQDTTGTQTNRADHPPLMPQASDISIGSDDNHATSDVESTSMYD